jgi:hypothetical protein
MAKKTAMKTTATKKSKARTKPARRTRWLDPKSKTPLIDDYARQMHAIVP